MCQEVFGTHPVQVFFEWNTAAHAEEFEGQPAKRPFTREELQRLFDHADDEVGRAVTEGDRPGNNQRTTGKPHTNTTHTLPRPRASRVAVENLCARRGRTALEPPLTTPRLSPPDPGPSY